MQRGLQYGIWHDILNYPHPDPIGLYLPAFYIANVEGNGDWSVWLADFRARYPKLPCALVTNFGGVDTPEKARPWIEARFALITEAYQNIPDVGAHWTPLELDFRGRQLGWNRTFPAVGVWGGYPLSDYTAQLERFGEGWSVYLAEGLFP